MAELPKEERWRRITSIGGTNMKDKMIKVLKVFLFVITVAAIAGCGTANVEKQVFNDETSPNMKTLAAPCPICYLASERAVLGQNFRIEKEDAQVNSFTAAKYFEDGKDSIVLTINLNIIAAGKDKSTIYASAVQHVEKVRVKTDRAFLGLVPVGSEATKVNQEERTVEDLEFYKKLFTAIDKELKILNSGK
jgi:hypothetical protein